MAKIFGKQYTRQELLQHVGSMDQLGGIRKVILDEGNEKGNEAVLFNTGSGLSFTAMAGRALDISSATYNGQSLCWRSPAGDVEASHFEVDGLGWLRNFAGGLVSTCGLTYAGGPHTDLKTSEGSPFSYEDEDGNVLWSATGSIGLHGRISNIPAKHLSLCEWWEGDDYWMGASGEMREGALFNPNIVLKRTIKAKLGENKLWINDVVENQGFRQQEHMFVYHCNFGFPAVAGGSQYLINSRKVTPRDAAAVPHLDRWADFPAPMPGVEEWVYYHDLACDEDNATAVAIVNRDFNNGQGFGGYLRFNREALPHFMQWKMPGQGEYVTGLEPGNCHVEGRVKDREEGRLMVLEPGESREYWLEVGVLEDNSAIADMAAEIAALS